MSVFLLPKWVLRKIDQIRKRFFWHGNKELQRQLSSLYMVNWTLATRPKQLGGLGIRNIQIANHALLMKWLWLWLHQHQAWWKQSTPIVSPSDKPWQSSQATPFWKDMAAVAPAFHPSISHRVGNVLITKYWHDNWQGKPFKHLFPNLYQADHNKHVSVADFLNGNNWMLNSSPLPPAAQLEQAQMVTLVQQFSLSQHHDEVIWLRHPTTFSAGSAYKFLSLTPSPESYIKNIWQIKAPLRTLIFAWLLLNNRLATIDNLTRRGWQLPNMCVMCKTNEESVQHLFQTCSMAKEVRAYIITAFGSRYPISMPFAAPDSTNMLADPAANMRAQQWELVTSFVLWRERCRRVFSDKELHVVPIVREIYSEYKSWFLDSANRATYDPG